MGWRYRKRIKILPGIHLNISKSGISTNVGVKGASVTFGPKGTYVNTGLPGTGLYRRDKVHEDRTAGHSTQTYHSPDNKRPQNVHVTREYDKTTSILAYNPLHYIFYFFSLIFPIAAFIWYLNNLDMIYCCLINAVFQAIWGLAIILNMSVKEDTSSYTIKSIKKVSKHYIKKEVMGHKIRCSLCVIIILLNLFPFLSMSGAFVRMFIGYEKTWDGGFISILITLIIIILWILALKKEKDFIVPLNDALLLKDKTKSNSLPVTSTNEECKTTNDELVKESNLNVSRETVDIETSQEESKAEPCSQKIDTRNEVGKDYSNANIPPATDSPDKENGVMCLEELEPYDPKRDLENYHYPTLDLLKKYNDDGLPHIDMEEQTANKNRIVEVLRSFGIEISSIKATIGSRFTLYEITPAPGIGINKVRGLEDDLALWLGTQGIRIIAPIPGKGTVGIEVPNMRPSMTSIDSIFNSKKFQESTMELPCALGKTITNEVFMFDLTKAPHVLIAGSTGQGKSVAINTILTSLLYKKHPAELKLVLMDPCVIELGVYSIIERHYLAALYDEPSVVINSNQAVDTLNSLCKEMDIRYGLLTKAYARNVKEYNKKFISRQLNPAIGHKFLPYIVVIIDEYANFISEKGKEFELPLVRLAQLARAVGIHVIISTKFPTNDIITGNIKSNFPTRISFRVPESVDSRVILDRNGAERLLGNGDMLYANGGEPVRVQCAFIDTPETERICQFISDQQGYKRPFELPDPYFDENEYNELNDVDMTNLDPLFEDAARLIVREQSGSTSLIQRKFAIGYNRAGRLMDQLEKAGVVGEAHGSKPREVFIQDEVSLENLFNALKW